MTDYQDGSPATCPSRWARHRPDHGRGAGLGLEEARVLDGRGAHPVLAGRDTVRCGRAAAEIRAAAGTTARRAFCAGA